MIRSTLTQRWQTTIPAEVRKALGLKPGQGLVYELRGGAVVVRPEGVGLSDLAGCLGDGTAAQGRPAERAAAVDRATGREARRTGGAGR